MLFHVRMTVNLDPALPAEEVADILSREKAYSQQLQASCKWRHIWRIAGAYANFSVFDVADNAELHAILSGLPLFKYMQIEVAPLVRHPSSIRDDDS
ncbi:MAG: muconolactone Delta-isomerase [Paracoccaceae bacterium]|nr:muconolactone Delta-isomerase [Paracoccaceae bacterium]